MRHVEAGGVRVSAIGLGTWQFGAREWGYGDDYARHEARAIVERALALGIDLVDTAEMYAFGRSERIVGDAVAGRRGEVFLATKLFPVAPFAPVVEWRARASARRLGVAQIDLYQVHWPNPVVPDGPTMAGMRRVLDSGLVAHAGVSNYSLARWCRAQDMLGRPVLSNQVKLNLAERGALRELVPWAQANDRIVIAYSPLAQGFLSGKYDAEHLPGGSARRTNTLFLPENLSRGADLLDVLRSVANRHDATPSQVALAWLIRRPNVVAIPGASSVAQLEANAAAADLDLSDADDAALTEAAEAFRPERGAAALPALARRLVTSR
ncbi:MAG TPA: aldo/keto reductase [Acidimicrobiia bacterium]|nr:aldo/keto reductase [Acidimicrobiia bacterium]